MDPHLTFPNSSRVDCQKYHVEFKMHSKKRNICFFRIYWQKLLMMVLGFDFLLYFFSVCNILITNTTLNRNCTIPLFSNVYFCCISVIQTVLFSLAWSIVLFKKFKFCDRVKMVLVYVIFYIK